MKFYIFLLVGLLAISFTSAAIIDLEQHGWDYVDDDGACGTNTITADDTVLTVASGSAEAQLIRVKWCITGQQDTPSSLDVYYSNTTDIVTSWDNSSDPYFYPIGLQNTTGAKFRWANSSYIEHNGTVACIQTDDHQPENGTVIEGPIASGFINQPSAANLCQEHELVFEYLGNENESWQFVMVLNGTIVDQSGMHSRNGIFLDTTETTITDYADGTCEINVSVHDDGSDSFKLDFDDDSSSLPASGVKDSLRVTSSNVTATTGFVNVTAEFSYNTSFSGNYTGGGWKVRYDILYGNDTLLTTCYEDSAYTNVTTGDWANQSCVLNASLFSDGEKYKARCELEVINNVSADVFALNMSCDHAHLEFIMPPDTTAPTWITIPAEEIALNDEAFLLLKFSASDASGIDTYWINWTENFTISSFGWLSNISTIAVGNYSINVSVNDTVGNVNSTIWNLQVTAGDTCTCTDGANWEIDMTDNCNLVSDCSPLAVTFINTGNFTCNALLNASSLGAVSTGQTGFVGSSCKIIANNLD